MKSITSQIKAEVKSAQHWTKEYLDSMFTAIHQERFEDALQIATELAPIWGEIETSLQEAIASQEK